jgi:hypothetical protein
MDDQLKRRLIIGLIALAFLSSGGLLLRYFFMPEPTPTLTEDEQKALGAIPIESYNLSNLPPQGDMSDKDYLLMLMRMREEADKPIGEPGSALRAINP